MAADITFLGAAGTVTGSKYLLEAGGKRLLVDCGLFQGAKPLRLRNWDRFAVDAASISAVVLTHAHIDHTGYLPLLVKQGFRGPVFCSAATRDLCQVLLPDTAHLQEQDAQFANRHGYSKHQPALPLYTIADADQALGQMEPVAFGEGRPIAAGATILLRHAGHILGAAHVELNWDGTTIVFSGDIGRYGDPLLPDPVTPPSADYVLIESTYGNRKHDAQPPEDVLGDVVQRTLARGGTIVIPSFAVGREQLVIYYLAKLKDAGRLAPEVRIYVDSPMAIDAGEIFLAHPGDHKLSSEEARRIFALPTYVRDGEASKAVTADPTPKIIVSASGMATGGRVLHHLAHYAPDARNTVLFVGYQAAGTRGAAMTGGAESIRIHGQDIPVKADVHNLGMLSAHADQDELLRWLSGFKQKPRTVFITHGEPAAADAVRQRIEHDIGWQCVVPEQHDKAHLA
ncbi:MAG: MBL fold metallo-hydrolase RNA specificity domain-containing protein [Rhizomicrobium sp.]|jgi:metallo-beta-lactamase family protein